MGHGMVLKKAITMLAYSNFVVLFTIPIVNIIGLCTNNSINPTIQAWMVGLCISLFLILAILFCIGCASQCEMDAFGYLDHHFTMVVVVLAFAYLLYWAGLIHKSNHDGRQWSNKATYENKYEFPAGCLECWMEKETDWTGNKQPVGNHVERHWSVILECMMENHFCERMNGDDLANMNLGQFYALALSSIVSGCCKPPDGCNFIFISPTNWASTADSTYTKCLGQ